jgi:alpha-mannosidase
MRPDTPRPGGALRASGTTIENDRLRLDLDPGTGRIARLELLDGAAARSFIAADRPRARVVDDTSDPWGHRMQAYREEVGHFEATSVELVERGPVRAILRVDSRFGHSRLIEDFVLTAGSDTLELRVILDWRERSKLLKLRFATTLSEPVATYEIPYGAIERPANGEEEPGQRWIDVTGRLPGHDGDAGLAILNDGKYGFDIHEGELGITAVRSPIYAHHEPTVPTPGVRYQFQDQGSQRFVLHLVPHVGDWRAATLTRRAMELNQRPTLLLESSHQGRLPAMLSLAGLEPEHVVMGALKMAEDDDAAIVRLVETIGRPGPVRLRFPEWDRDERLDIGPFEIRTYRVPKAAGDPMVEVDLLERPLPVPAAPLSR